MILFFNNCFCASESKEVAHFIWSMMKDLGLESFDMDSLGKELKEVKNTPPLDINLCAEKVMSLKRAHLEKESQKKRERAVAFLLAIKKEEGVKELVQDKLYFKNLKKGVGKVLQNETEAVFSIKAYSLDGELIFEEGFFKQDLEESIAGFSQGVIGMEEKEERKLYIHPDLAYGPFPPFSDEALVIDVTLESLN
jgi:FKBP-type peptidyl-prolyl cis-trans isomerase